MRQETETLRFNLCAIDPVGEHWPAATVVLKTPTSSTELSVECLCGLPSDLAAIALPAVKALARTLELKADGETGSHEEPLNP